MGAKRKSNWSDQAPEGVPTLGSLLARQSNTSAALNVVNLCDPVAEEPQVDDSAAANADNCDAGESEPVVATKKAKRFVLDRDMPIMAYFEFKMAKSPDSSRQVEMLHCKACNAGAEPEWSRYKQDTVRKHLGRCFDGQGELIPRTDGESFFRGPIAKNLKQFTSKKAVFG